MCRFEFVIVFGYVKYMFKDKVKEAIVLFSPFYHAHICYCALEMTSCLFSFNRFDVCSAIKISSSLTNVIFFVTLGNTATKETECSLTMLIFRRSQLPCANLDQKNSFSIKMSQAPQGIVFQLVVQQMTRAQATTCKILLA